MLRTHELEVFLAGRKVLHLKMVVIFVYIILDRSFRGGQGGALMRCHYLLCKRPPFALALCKHKLEDCGFAGGANPFFSQQKSVAIDTGRALVLQRLPFKHHVDSGSPLRMNVFVGMFAA